MTSSAVSRTCPTRRPCRPKAAVYRATSRPCPTLAAACWVARSRGRRSSPSGSSPAAMEPEDTRTTSVPRSRCAANASTRASSWASSIIPSGVVRELDPTLTTTRTAAGRSARPDSALLLIVLVLIVLGRDPATGRPLLGQLVASPVGGRPPLRQGLALGAAGRTLPLRQSDVGSAR